MSHEVLVALPKRGLGGAQVEVVQESQPPLQLCPYFCYCPSWPRPVANGKDAIVPALEATRSLDPLFGGRVPLVDVYHRPEKRPVPGEETAVGVRA